MNNIANIENT